MYNNSSHSRLYSLLKTSYSHPAPVPQLSPCCKFVVNSSPTAYITKAGLKVVVLQVSSRRLAILNLTFKSYLPLSAPAVNL
jgi:hypothetical protein